jgi:hypothetical protein
LLVPRLLLAAIVASGAGCTALSAPPIKISIVVFDKSTTCFSGQLT